MVSFNTMSNTYKLIRWNGANLTWIEMFASSVIQVMVGASDPVRGPHPIRASEQEKEICIQGGMVGKKSDGAEVLDCGRVANEWSRDL